jgi:hypothetical protein
MTREKTRIYIEKIGKRNPGYSANLPCYQATNLPGVYYKLLHHTTTKKTEESMESEQQKINHKDTSKQHTGHSYVIHHSGKWYRIISQ